MKGDIVPVKERYTEYGKDWVKRYSDNGMMMERDGVRYSEAIDPAGIPHEYTETDEPIDSGEELTVSDTLGMLSEMGVKTTDD